MQNPDTLEVGYGWYRGTAPVVCYSKIMDLLTSLGGCEALDRGRYGYTNGWGFAYGIVLLYSIEGRNSGHICLDIPASGLAYLQERVRGGLPSFFTDISDIGFICRRIDISIDCYAVSLPGAGDLASVFMDGGISAQSLRGDGGRSLQSYIYAAGCTVDGEPSSPRSSTISFGSRTSESYYRVYHKGAERYQASASELKYANWIEQGYGRDQIRVEGEFKSNTAALIYNSLLADKFDLVSAQGILVGGVDFAGAWGEVLKKKISHVAPIALPSTALVPPSISRSINWIRHSVAPTLASLRVSARRNGMQFGRWLVSLLEEASSNGSDIFGPKHDEEVRAYFRGRGFNRIDFTELY